MLSSRVRLTLAGHDGLYGRHCMFLSFCGSCRKRSHTHMPHVCSKTKKTLSSLTFSSIWKKYGWNWTLCLKGWHQPLGKLRYYCSATFEAKKYWRLWL